MEDYSGEDNTLIITSLEYTAPPIINLEYSYDTINWMKINTPEKSMMYTCNIFLPKNKKIYLRGKNTTFIVYYKESERFGGNYIRCEKKYNVGGNIMSLLYGNNFIGQTELLSDWCFAQIFGTNNFNIINAKDLILPATTLRECCYRWMFDGAINLKTCPVLLPATTLANYCYHQMYYNCNSLTTISELPATILEAYSYCQMYYYTSIINTPVLSHIKEIHTMSIYLIFKGCSNLKIVYTPQINYSSANWEFGEWLTDVSPTGTIYIPYNVDWRDAPRNGSGIPSGWEIKYIDPDTMEERESLYPIVE